MAQHPHTHRYHHPGLAAHADTAPGRAPGQQRTHARALRGHRSMTHDTPNPTHAPAIVTVVSVGLDATAPLNACSPTSVTRRRSASNTNNHELRSSATTPARPSVPPPWPRRACVDAATGRVPGQPRTYARVRWNIVHGTRSSRPHARTFNCHGRQRRAGRHGTTECLQPHVGHSGEVYDKQQPR